MSFFGAVHTIQQESRMLKIGFPREAMVALTQRSVLC